MFGSQHPMSSHSLQRTEQVLFELDISAIEKYVIIFINLNLSIYISLDVSGDVSSSRNRRSVSSFSKQHYIEVMIVADSTMYNYHRDNLHHYLFTLMSVVSTIQISGGVFGTMEINYYGRLLGGGSIT